MRQKKAALSVLGLFKLYILKTPHQYMYMCYKIVSSILINN